MTSILRQRMLDAMVLQRQGGTYPGGLHWRGVRPGAPLPPQPGRPDGARRAALLAAPAARAASCALQRQPVQLRVSFPLRPRARAGRPDLPDPAGTGPAAVARDPLAPGARVPVCRGLPPEGQNVPDAGLRQRTAPVGAVPTARRAHRQPRRPHVHPCRARQGGEGPLRAAGRRCAATAAHLVARSRPGAWLFGALRDPSRPLDTGSAQRWYYRALRRRRHHQARRYPLRCATPTPRTCWRPATTCTACSNGSATATSAPRRATCT